MEVVVGTYNHVIFGFSFKLENKKDKKVWQFGPLFTDQGHAGCIKSVSSNGRYLATGSTDETIRLFDLKKHVEVGTLMEQTGSITSLEFCGTTHLLSGSEDGTICVWKSRSWELLKKLKGHRDKINSLSLHPSGRLALSVSKDKYIRTWNLITGRPAYTTNLKEVAELVRWSPKGDCYAITVGSKVTFHQITGADDPVVYKYDKYILALEFLTENVVCIAGDSEDIIFYDYKKKIVLQRLEAHKLRTKAICLTDNPYLPSDEWMLFTTSSNGNLKAWTVSKSDLEKKPTLLAELDMPGRPTCMTLKIPTDLQTYIKEEQTKEEQMEPKTKNQKEEKDEKLVEDEKEEESMEEDEEEKEDEIDEEDGEEVSGESEEEEEDEGEESEEEQDDESDEEETAMTDSEDANSVAGEEGDGTGYSEDEFDDDESSSENEEEEVSSSEEEEEEEEMVEEKVVVEESKSRKKKISKQDSTLQPKKVKKKKKSVG
ncbi:p21-activated protein kinase-interacting protein 1-like isoform X1 [Clytia hemisphaerica]|uniref:P21-activated protein kinase-interacting protein 1-like n=1 Tax=Clytia hemisphaerica TaxID=252671 RepID=A0A7M6DQC5_9CNID